MAAPLSVPVSASLVTVLPGATPGSAYADCQIVNRIFKQPSDLAVPGHYSPIPPSKASITFSATFRTFSVVFSTRSSHVSASIKWK